MKKALIFINCLIILVLTIISPVAAEEKEKIKVRTKGEYYDISAPDYATEIALLVNVDTDTVIYSKNADKITAPASLTKLVTALVVFEECDDLQKKVKCSYDAIHSLDGTGSSVARLLVDEVTTVEMLLYCLFLPSANDAAMVLAEEFGGKDVSAFVDKMNTCVEKLGCKNTYFANPHGLDDESVEGYVALTQNRTTAEDMYLIAKAALENEALVKIATKYGKTMPETNKSDIRYLYNTNPLLNSYSDYYYEYAVGLKTGTTDKAGCCLISSATKDGYTYLSIAMRGRDDYTYVVSEDKVLHNANTAFLMCRYMLDWAFRNIHVTEILGTTAVVGETKVKFGRGSDYVGLVPSKQINAIIHKELEFADLSVVMGEDYPQEVDSPIEKGDKICDAKLMYRGVCIADLELVAYQSVKRNYLWAAFSWMEKIATSKLFIPVVAVIVIVALVLYFGTKNKRKRRKRAKNTVKVVKDYSKLSK